MKRITLSIIAALMILACFWMGGLEFDQRSLTQGYAFFLAMVAGSFTYILSGLYKK